MSSRQSSRNASTPYLAKAFQATAIVVVSYFLYWTYQLYQYGEIPISKKDVMLRQAILARFPADYEVEIKGADLLGFGEIPGRLRQSALRRQGLRHGRPGHRAPGAEPGTDQPAAGEGVLHRRTRPPLLAAQPLPVPGYPEEHGRAEPPGIPEDPVGPLRSGREAKPREQFETDYAFPSCSASANWKSPTTTATAATNCAWATCPTPAVREGRAGR